MEPEAMQNRVKAYIEEIRPYIQSHGGDVEFVSMEGMVVRLKLLGACRACPSAVFTLKQGIETQMREQISPDLTVERVG